MNKTVLGTMAIYKKAQDKAAHEKDRIWLGKNHEVCTIK